MWSLESTPRSTIFFFLEYEIDSWKSSDKKGRITLEVDQFQVSKELETLTVNVGMWNFLCG